MRYAKNQKVGFSMYFGGSVKSNSYAVPLFNDSFWKIGLLEKIVRHVHVHRIRCFLLEKQIFSKNFLLYNDS